MKFLWLLPGALLLALAVALIRTLFLKPKVTAFSLSEDAERVRLYSEKLSRMVRTETVSHREDPEVEKFRAFHTVLAELFPTVFETLEKTEIDGNLLLRWKGSDSSLAPIMLISHMDVVPAEGKWTYPPFSGTLADGKIWGRGAGDIKEGLMAILQSAEELLQEGYTPRCDVYLGSSCTEEIGGDGAPKLAAYLKERGIRPFMLLDEGGGIVQDPVSGVKGNFCAIGIFEKGYGDLKFIARSAGGHSSTPPRHTPIARLAAFENRVERRSPFRSRFTPAVKTMFRDLAPYCRKFGLKLVMYNLWLFGPLVKLLLPSISAEAAAMLKTTVAFTMQKGSDGYNVLPQEAWVTANLRYIPHQKRDESNAILRALAAKYGVETEVLYATEPSASLDLRGDAYRMTVDAAQKVFPGIGIMPYVVTGGTDSRFYGDVCDACVRFSPVNMDPEELKAMHGIDEHIHGGALPGAVDFYKTIIRSQESR